MNSNENVGLASTAIESLVVGDFIQSSAKSWYLVRQTPRAEGTHWRIYVLDTAAVAYDLVVHEDKIDKASATPSAFSPTNLIRKARARRTKASELSAQANAMEALAATL